MKLKAMKKNAKSKENSTPGGDEPRSSTPLTTFYKKQIFNQLNLHGCSEESLEAVLNRFKEISKEQTSAFFNELIRQAEIYLHQECGSLCFDNNEAWLDIMRIFNLTVPSEAFAEYLETIADVEPLPAPADLNGINLRDIYKFLSNAMLGLPQPALDQPTAEFLSSEFKELVNAVNSQAGEDIVYAMFEKLREFPTQNYNFDALDPFALNDS